jgi:AraC family transcriptional regulator of adaptative response/methylated-DNA-[protein]-cysteine methyltransferase
MTAASCQTDGQGKPIGYTVVGTAVGTVVAAQTARGVCAVYIGRDETTLINQLQAEFPWAKVEPDDNNLRETALAVLRAAQGRSSPSQPPLDLQGSPFQMRVWRALRTIPAGQTRTYSEIATQIGATSSARAVASACAANQVALLIPCHRAVRADGTLGGYRWGQDIKQALLAAETAVNPVQPAAPAVP